MKRFFYIISFMVICALIVWILSSFDKVYEPEPYQLEYPLYFGSRYTIPKDNPTTKEGVTLGRMLFYETSLSSGEKISCASCHQQKYAFTDGKDFSQGVDGVKQSRNTMALVNLLWVTNLFWDGRVRGLEEQVKSPLTNVHEMGQPIEVSIKKLKSKRIYYSFFKAAFGDNNITKERIEKALAQFERSLISANSKYDLYLNGKYKPTSSELNGIDLFYKNPNPKSNIRGASCFHCHSGEKTYQELFMNNGLDEIYKDLGRASVTGQSYDNGRFRVVTLRNIALTAPYMHDARFKTLEEVIDHYSDHVANSKELSPFLQNNSNTTGGTQLDLTKQEKRDLIAFLHMLTDSTFIKDQRFSNPFNKKRL